MKRICMGLAAALAFAVFGTATALAQPTEDKAAPDKGFIRIWDPSAQAGDVQEEMEILRRLLGKSFEGLEGLYGNPTLVSGFGDIGPRYAMLVHTGETWLWNQVTADMQGVYLKDYGVVYTVTLPPPPNHMPPGPSVGVVTRTPLSPWERTRKELRGEKIEDEGKGAKDSPALSDVILKMLADNGKHFTRLAEGERITVAVTFRDDAANGINQPQPPGSGWGSSMPGMMSGVGSPSSLPPGMSLPGFGSMAPSAPPKDEPAWLADVRNGLTLGDLHVKQQNYPAALAAYKIAQEHLHTIGFVHKDMTPDAAAGLLTAVHLYLQLAKGYEAAGDNAASRSAMQKVAELSKSAATLTVVAAPAATATPAAPASLPSKLVVTASKKLLDEVGSGKMTFEAFRKAATVEYVTPPAADKK